VLCYCNLFLHGCYHSLLYCYYILIHADISHSNIILHHSAQLSSTRSAHRISPSLNTHAAYIINMWFLWFKSSFFPYQSFHYILTFFYTNISSTIPLKYCLKIILIKENSSLTCWLVRRVAGAEIRGLFAAFWCCKNLGRGAQTGWTSGQCHLINYSG